MRILVFLLILICSLRSIAQDFSYSEVSKISENVNSEAEEIMPLLAPDGRTLYFVRAFSALNRGGINAGQDIWTSEKDEEGWASVCNVGSLNNGENNAVIGMNHTGKVVYLINNYTALPRRKQGVVSMRKTGKRWKMLSELPLLIDIKTDHYGFYISRDEDVLLISMSGEESLGEEDLYVSFKNDEDRWTTPKHLGMTVNSQGFEIAPFLSADRKYLYFASNGFDGLGSADIYVSERLDDSWDRWSAPQNLGSQINSAAFDAYYSESEDGIVFFSSNRGGGFADIYMARKIAKPDETDLIAELPDEPEDSVETADNSGPDVNLPEGVRVHFYFDQYRVTPEAAKILDQVAAILQEKPELNSLLAGHTCDIGTEEYNERLSRHRAKAVEDYLVAQGIPKHRITVEYFGERHPRFENNSKENRSANRRVEVTFSLGPGDHLSSR